MIFSSAQNLNYNVQKKIYTMTIHWRSSLPSHATVNPTNKNKQSSSLLWKGGYNNGINFLSSNTGKEGHYMIG